MQHQGLLDEGGEIAENLLDVFLTEEKFILELLLGKVFQIFGILLLKGRRVEGFTLDSLEGQIHQLELSGT
jgi:hypothetical protein